MKSEILVLTLVIVIAVSASVYYTYKLDKHVKNVNRDIECLRDDLKTMEDKIFLAEQVQDEELYDDEDQQFIEDVREHDDGEEDMYEYEETLPFRPRSLVDEYEIPREESHIEEMSSDEEEEEEEDDDSSEEQEEESDDGIEFVEDVEKTCQSAVKTGPRKGQVCGKKTKNSEYCVKHMPAVPLSEE